MVRERASDGPTLVDLLRARAAAHPERLVYQYLRDDGAGVDVLSYRVLDARARQIASLLRETGHEGDRVLVVFPAGLDFISALFGVLYAGMIAVPAYPPTRERESKRLAAIARSAVPACGLTLASMVEEVQRAFDDTAQGGFACPMLLAVDSLTPRDVVFHRPRISPESVAFLQYTSGSTAHPKGVIVSHDNVLQNEGMLKSAFGNDEDSVIVGWLPHIHDMGLIGNVLHPPYVNARCVLMSPSTFIRDPMRWLRTIARYGARTSGGPNFAYELCVRRFKARDATELDLSCWEVAFVGAEPIRRETLRRFAEVFEPYGFRASALHPCYGLAEATLVVSAGPMRAASASGSDAHNMRVNCGHAVDGLDVRVVDPVVRTVCRDGVEGEVWVRGPSIAAGYWDACRETLQTFGAELADGQGPFMRTGDLAIGEKDHLFITGRIKDLIIVNGQNYHPHDVEALAEGVGGGVRAGGAVAFSFADGDSERACLLIEITPSRVEGPLEDLCTRIRAAVGDTLQLRLDVVGLLPAQTVLKTTSGKVQRRAMCAAFLDGTLTLLASSQVASARPCSASGQ